jgi:general secretion pathway protein G
MNLPNIPRGQGRPRPPGFTLIEVLIVLLIITILIGVLLPAIGAALRAGKRAGVKAEISQLAAAQASFKAKYGEYPPSRVFLSENGHFMPTTNPNLSVAATMAPLNIAPEIYDVTMGELAQRSAAILRKIFPKVNLSTTNPIFAPGSTEWYDFNGNGTFDGWYVLQGHECLVFFLGGIPLQSTEGYSMTGFGTNPANPFTNSIVGNSMYGANRTPPFYEFAPSRLVIDATNETAPGIPGYYDTIGDTQLTPGGTVTNRRINYQNGQINFYAYFSTTGLGGKYDPNDVNFLATENDCYLTYYGRNVAGSTLNSRRTQGLNPVSPGPNPYTNSTTFPPSGTVSYHNPQSFQIISAGYDGLYGIGGQYAPPPATPALPIDATSVQPSPLPSKNPNPNVEPASLGKLRDRERDNITNFGANSQLD